MQINKYLYWYSKDKPFQFFFGRGNTCNVFALCQDEEIWLFDCGVKAFGRIKRIMKWMQNDGLNPLKITKVFITHAHPDHINALEFLLAFCNPVIYLHESDLPLLEGGDDYFWAEQVDHSDGLFSEVFPASPKICKFFAKYSMGKMPLIGHDSAVIKRHTEVASQNRDLETSETPLVLLLEDKDIVQGSSFSVQAVHTPGHTLGHLCYYIPELQAMFLGDLIDPYFDHKPPLNLFTSDYARFEDSLKKVAKFEIEYFCAAHATEIHQGIQENKALCDGTIKQLQFGKSETIRLLKEHKKMRLKDFQGQFSKEIWQLMDHRTLPLAVIRSLWENSDARIKREGNFFEFND